MSLAGTQHDTADAVISDLGPLAWVFEELRKSLESANKALRRFSLETRQARESDLGVADPAPLRVARTQLHQATGALEMVGLNAPAIVIKAMEAAVQKFLTKPNACTDDAIEKLERAGFALVEYLESVLNNKSIQPTTLFPNYRDVQELAGAQRVHPADLWEMPSRRSALHWPAGIQLKPLPPGTEVRSQFDQNLLHVIRNQNQAAAAQLKNVAGGLAAHFKSNTDVGLFWVSVAAYFEGIEHELLPNDVYVKRAASRVLLQYSSLAQGKYDISQELFKDLLFLLSQARMKDNTVAPWVSAIRQAWGLTQVKPVDYEKASLGRFDPQVLVQARKRIATARESWALLSGGDVAKQKQVVDHFSLVGDSLQKVFPHGLALAKALVHAVDITKSPNGVPTPELGIEVATAILYLEAVLQELDLSDPHLDERLTKLAHRVTQAHANLPSAPLEHWMEDLYRRVSDRNTMGSVVGELKVALAELERSLDQFFREPANKTPLVPVPQQLSQMRGVLSVLGLQHATQAVLRMRDTVNELLIVQIDETKARETGTFGHLANNLSALSFLIDMLNYQPTLARKLFIFDAEVGELKPLMGRTQAETRTVQADADASDGIIGLDIEQPPEEQAAPLIDILDDLDVSLAAPSAPEKPDTDSDATNLQLPRTQQTPYASLLPTDSSEVAFSPAPSLAPLPAPVVQPPLPSVSISAPVQVSASSVDPELLEIFLEEAQEVIGAGLAAIATLSRTPSSPDDLTTLRRAFHTLKGSSRMVGLNEFGESGWAMEQLLNAWLAEAKPATPDLCRLSQTVLGEMKAWIACIAAQGTPRWTSDSFRRSADALRLRGEMLPLSFDAAPLPPAPAETPVASSFNPPAVQASLVVTDLTFAPTDFDSVRVFDEQALPEPLSLSDIAMSSDEAFPLAAITPITQPETVVAEELTDADFDNFFGAGVTAPSPEVPITASTPTDDWTFSIPEPEVVDRVPSVASSAELDLSTTQPLPLVTTAVEPIAVEFDMVPISDGSEVSPNNDLGSLLEMVETDSDGDFAFVESVVAPSSVPQAIPSPNLPPALSVVVSPPPLQPSSAATDQASTVMASEQDDGTKQIGTLRIGVRLFHVFLSEADEWSRRLNDLLSAWVENADIPMPQAPEKLAHSIAGSSGAVGFTSLSQLARALEHGLDVARAHEQAGGIHKLADIQLFANTAHEIRRLLHQFAAGFLKDPQPQWLVALNEYVHRPAPTVAGFDPGVLPPESEPFLLEDMTFDEAQTKSASSVTSAVFAPDVIDVPSSQHAQETDAPHTTPALIDSEPQLLPVQSVVFVPPSAPSFVHEPTVAETAPVQDIDDDIDVSDDLDADLFQIFEEEALELIPRLSESLRRWVNNPIDAAARVETLRALHTLKGSARLTGALRLGEMSHRMESQAESFGSELDASTDLEPLLTAFDAIASRFEAIRQPETAVVPNRTQSRVEEVADHLPLPTQKLHEGETVGASPAKLPSNVELTQGSQPAVAPFAPFATSTTTVSAVQPKVLRANPATRSVASAASIRVRADLLDRLVNQTGEVMITRSRMDAEMTQVRVSLKDLSDNLERLRYQLRDIELQAEGQMQSRLALAKEQDPTFDPLEFDRFTRMQELTRMMAESVNDIATVQRNLARSVEVTEDGLIAQTRQTRELQRDLLRTRMVEFDGISERLYRVVRQAAKDSGKQVRLDIEGGRIEMDRSVLDRMTPAFEHLLRNCVGHGIEPPQVRQKAGKSPEGSIMVRLVQEGNDVSVIFEDDGAGLNVAKIRAKAVERGLIAPDDPLSNEEAGQLIFAAGLSTAAEVTGLSGRGIGMDVVRSEVVALGGRIETTTQAGQGTQFRMVLPLTTAVTQVVMLRVGRFTFGVPSGLIEIVRRVSPKELEQAYDAKAIRVVGEDLPFYWAGVLLQTSRKTEDTPGRSLPVVIFRSAAQRIAVHVDEVLGNQEVVVKNLGPQLSRLPGLAGITVLASGAAALIYNPVALAKVYGTQMQAWAQEGLQPLLPPTTTLASVETERTDAPVAAAVTSIEPPSHTAKPKADVIPLVLVVDDSITVRRVTQRLLQREGYRVALAADGLQALERLQEEKPTIVLSDIEMPRMDGFDLVRNIRADARLADLPVVMITSRIAEKHREHALELGVDHYLGKPYSEEILLGLIRQHCGAIPAL